MKLPPEIKASIVGTISGVAAVGIALAAGAILRPKAVVASAPIAAPVLPPDRALANEGYKLFMRNCAHCHGQDARGEEGPDLHGVTKSDQRIASIIQNGIKGQMPRFSAKLNPEETQALIAFIRTLKEA